MSAAPDSPNVWVDCACGERHWGRYGAAGLLLVHHPGHGAWGGGTRLLGGGAAAAACRLDPPRRHLGLAGRRARCEETPQQAALREAAEEAGLRPEGVHVLDLVVDDHGSWSYTYVLAEIATRPGLTPADEETEDLAWVRIEDVAAYPLHPHFAAAWPALRDRVDRLVRRS